MNGLSLIAIYGFAIKMHLLGVTFADTIHSEMFLLPPSRLHFSNSTTYTKVHIIFNSNKMGSYLMETLLSDVWYFQNAYTIWLAFLP